MIPSEFSLTNTVWVLFAPMYIQISCSFDLKRINDNEVQSAIRVSKICSYVRKRFCLYRMAEARKLSSLSILVSFKESSFVRIFEQLATTFGKWW
jgi:hypothetical protein